MHSQLIEPPSSRTILEKSRVKASYLDFWNRIKNNEALLPVYSPDIIEDLFDRASEIVARIRLLLNRQNPSSRVLRNSCKFTTEKLWQDQLTEKPITNPEEFVRDLVHTSLQDAQGKYIHHLTPEKVDEYIKIVQEYLDQARSKQERSVIGKLKENASEILKLIDQLDLDGECWKNYAMYLNLKKLADETSNLKDKIQKLVVAKENLPANKQAETPAPISQDQPTPMEESGEKSGAEEKKEDGNEKEGSQPVPSQEERPSTPADQVNKEEDQEEEKNQDSQPQEKANEDPSPSSSTEDEKKEGQEEEDSEEGSRTPTTTKKKYQIKINQVADDVSLMRGKVQHLAEVAERLDLAELAKNPREGTRAVNDLQKKCLQYTEHLMKNLLSLDEIIGSTTARTQKKQQINTIQELMSDMDSVNDRLKKLSETLKPSAEELEKEEREQKEREQKEREQKEREESERKRKLLEEEQELKKKKTESPKQTPPGQQKKKPVVSEEEEEEEEQEDRSEKQQQQQQKGRRIPEKLWRSLKLNANLEARELRDRFVIVGQLPGVRREDLSVDLSPNQTLTISGVRLPTAEEEELMIRHAQSAWARNPRLARRIESLSPDDKDRAVVEMASGRFGTFHETYRLPSNVDKTAINATLERGSLQVVIPKISAPPRSRGAPFYSDYDDLFW
eukprot:TRINITY_DN32_c0_g1_i1.p1 TRINITY_DN32_c0_g1~~TRINITY_DN32_c0_g1_i1.p1  ORF type:complete len:685 (-),score=244.98 TRINITY_DN32_c0_g1_i1:50-2077(-)